MRSIGATILKDFLLFNKKVLIVTNEKRTNSNLIILVAAFTVKSIAQHLYFSDEPDSKFTTD